MASLRFAVVVAVLAGVAAAAPPTNTTESTNITLEEKRRLADEACKHIEKHDICHELCLLKNLGAVNDAGRYMEEGAVDLLAISLPKEERNEAVIKQAAKTCNSVNDHIVEGCNRALQVGECLMTEQDKITNRDRRAAKAAAANKNCTNENDDCHESCVFSSFGVVEHEGGVDARNAIDYLAVTYPALSYYKLRNIAYSCAFRVAVETAGPWAVEAREFIGQLGRRLRDRGCDPRSGSYLVQQISLAIQRGNAASIMGTFAPGNQHTDMNVTK